MAGHLSKADLGIINKWIEAGVLRDVDPQQLAPEEGEIIIICPDGHRFPNVFNHHVKLMEEAGVEIMLHVLGFHGGGLACAPCSPINRRKDDHRVFLDQVSDAIKLKGVYTVSVHAHAPCGAAGLHGVDLTTEVALLMRAKQMIKNLQREFSREIKVILLFDVDYGNGKQRTYHLCSKQWALWANKHDVKTIC